jgi:4-hydroxy 2-oxovalerate aldolase
MQIIDVTLRDGGHVREFNWPIKFAKDHYKALSKIPEIKYIELGYWKQTSKSKNPFYNLNLETVNKITSKRKLCNVSIMIDYHYCSKKFSDYPKNNQKEIAMIRVCSRKEDIPKALVFSENLKKYTGLNISFNIFNSTNYSNNELLKVSKLVSKYKIDYVYFADTHGDMDLEKTYKKFAKPLSILSKSGKKVGMHLHDHSGKGYFNYRQLKRYKIFKCDSSVRGMGKGFGNLRTEQIVKPKYFKIIGTLVKKYNDLLTMPQNIYTLITSQYAISDLYASQAKKIKMDINSFSNLCKKVSGKDKDNFNKKKYFKFD